MATPAAATLSAGAAPRTQQEDPVAKYARQQIEAEQARKEREEAKRLAIKQLQDNIAGTTGAELYSNPPKGKDILAQAKEIGLIKWFTTWLKLYSLKKTHTNNELENLLGESHLTGDKFGDFLAQYQKIEGIGGKPYDYLLKHITQLESQAGVLYSRIRRLPAPNSPEDFGSYKALIGEQLLVFKNLVSRLAAYKSHFQERGDTKKVEYLQGKLEQVRSIGAKAILDLAKQNLRQDPALAERYLELLKEQSESPESLFHPLTKNINYQREIGRLYESILDMRTNSLENEVNSLYSATQQLELQNTGRLGAHEEAVRKHMNTTIKALFDQLESLKGKPYLSGKDITGTVTKLKHKGIETILEHTGVHIGDNPELAAVYLNAITHPESPLYSHISGYRTKIDQLKAKIGAPASATPLGPASATTAAPAPGTP
jgi:hypothetical protein